MSTLIVGAGIFGLALGQTLKQRGHAVRVLEAQGRPGGTIQSTWREGFLTEAGPNGFLDREPATLELVEALGLSDALKVATAAMKRRFVFTRGALREVPTSPPKFLSSDVLPLSARLRMALEPLSRRGPEDDDESVACFARRHLGRQATAVLVDALQSGIFAGDVERLSLAACFPRLRELEREHRSLVLGLLRLRRSRQAGADVGTGPSGALCSFENGLSQLTEACGASLGDSLWLNARARALKRSGAGWEVAVETPRGAQTVEAARLVLALPSYAAAKLVAPLDRELAQSLAAIPYAKVAAVHVGLAPGALRAPLEGFGFLVPFNEGRRLLGVIYASSVFPFRAPEGHSLLTCMVGGARAPEHVALDDAALTTLVREELASTLGLTADPCFVAINRWQRGIPQYLVGHPARVDALEERAARLGLFLGGNAYRGVGINDCVRNARALVDLLR